MVSICRRAGLILGSTLILVLILMLMVQPVHGKTHSISSGGKYVIQRMLKHDSKIVLDVKTTANENSFKKKFKEAVKCDNSKTMGDYVFYEMKRYKYKYDWVRSNGVYRYHIVLKTWYKSTKSQNKVFEKKLNSTMKSLKLNGKSEYQKVKKIYDYINKRTTFTSNGNTTKYTAYSALCKRKGNCQAYANLFYRMCKKVGVKVCIVSGYTNGKPHAWNIVRVNGKWYNVDASWENGTGYKYFLKSRFSSHIRRAEYKTSSFNKAHPMSTTNYYKIQSTKTKLTGTYVSRSKVKMKWKRISDSQRYQIYKYNGKSFKRVATTKKNTYMVKRGKKTQNIYKVRGYRKVGNKKVYSKWSNYLVW